MPAFLLASVVTGWIVIVLAVAGWRLDRRGAAERRADPARMTLAAMRAGPAITITATVFATIALVVTAAWPVAAGDGQDQALIPDWLAFTIALVGLGVVLLVGAVTIRHLPRVIAPALVNVTTERLEIHHRFRHTLDTIRLDEPFEISHEWHRITRPRQRGAVDPNAISVRRRLTLRQGSTVVCLSVTDALTSADLDDAERIRRPPPWRRRTHLYRASLGLDLFDQLLAVRAQRR